MKRKLQTLVLALAFLLPTTLALAPASTSAVDVFHCTGALADTSTCKSKGDGKTNPVIGALKVAISIIAIVIGIASVIVIILAGLTLITSNGDPQAVAKARSSIIYALVGVVVAVLAGSIVAFVLTKL